MRSLAQPSLAGAALRAGSRAAAPVTLLELAGGPAVPGRLAHSVVIVIDAQREYVDGRLPLAGVSAALVETHQLLVRARAAGVPIVHVQHVGPPGRGVFASDGAFVAFARPGAPAPGETIITKTRPNAFAGTTFDETLRRIGRTELIVSGYMTHLCVSTTVRSALDHGYHATVVASACATRDLPDGLGGVIPAATVHRVALAELADRFGTVVENLDAIPD